MPGAVLCGENLTHLQRDTSRQSRCNDHLEPKLRICALGRVVQCGTGVTAQDSEKVAIRLDAGITFMSMTVVKLNDVT